MSDLQAKAIELRREYMRKWRKANKEKVRKHTADYWERQAAKEAEQTGGEHNE